MLQHRGQDAAGAATLDGSHIYLHKGRGLVRDVFADLDVADLPGDTGIAHVRYPTAGGDAADESQPLYVNSPYGLLLAHNGNLTNTEALKTELFETDRRHLNTESDSEVLLNVLAHEIQVQHDAPLQPDTVFRAVDRVHQRCSGAYAAVALIAGLGMVAFRDPWGIRPLVLGRRETGGATEWAVASESAALDILGFELERDIDPAESVLIDQQGRLHTHQSSEARGRHPCIFEYVYLARPDSMMDNISVYKARLRMGEMLAQKILRERPDHDIDVVIPIPDTSRTAALPIAHALDVKYREGLIKNRYVGRTFIMPGQAERARSVRRKLNAIELEFRNKNVLLVDDSIVRGTTSRQIIQMARDAGANKVYLASAAPPVRYPNVYGIDMPAASELIAGGRSADEVQAAIGADWLIYQDLDDLVTACQEGNPDITGFDTSCFSAEYITGVPEDYFENLAEVRSDEAKSRRLTSSAA